MSVLKQAFKGMCNKYNLCMIDNKKHCDDCRIEVIKEWLEQKLEDKESHETIQESIVGNNRIHYPKSIEEYLKELLEELK